MFFSSPVHCNTNIEGRYTLKATDNDVHLYAYYPGKSFANVKRAVDDRQVKIVMQSGKHKSVQRQPAQATRWYDPVFEESQGPHGPALLPAVLVTVTSNEILPFL